MLSKTQLTIATLIIATICLYTVNCEWNDADDSIVDPEAENGDKPFNPYLYDMPMFMDRKRATDFYGDNDNKYDSFIKRKLDQEEIREINAKADARRKKAYQNYEESCKIKGKFTVRSCPKLNECYVKNKIKEMPKNYTTATNSTTASTPTSKPGATTTSTTTKSKSIISKMFGKDGRREFIERELAVRFLDNLLEERSNDDGEEDNDNDDDIEEIETDLLKRFFSKDKSKTTAATTTTKKPVVDKELIEETKERKAKAFKKYEEYCEKRKFRIGATRNCPPLDQKLC